MSNHQAPEQMLGYIYQIRYALYLLLQNDDPDAIISIEKFDDIALTTEDDNLNTYIQLKHHTKNHGSLTDSSTDVWRTLNAWINEIKKDISILNNTKFLIITTAKSPVDSACSLLSDDMNSRNTEKAFEKLLYICNNSDNKAHEFFYENFKVQSDTITKKLVEKIYIIDNAYNIVESANEIKKRLRYGCKEQHISSVFERLEGWWYNKSIEALNSVDPVFINAKQVTSYIVDLNQQYRDDNLPIDIYEDDLDFENAKFITQMFYEQLKLIGVSSRKLTIALQDYYKAFRQRANWVRNDLLYLNELDSYERRLIDEWEHCFIDMLDNIDMNNISDDIDVKKLGRQLLNQIESKDIRVRERCSEPFIMRGSYHMLADQFKIGWHADFKNRLKYLLKEEDSRDE